MYKQYQEDWIKAFEAITGLHFTRNNHSTFHYLFVKNRQRVTEIGLDITSLATHIHTMMDDEDLLIEQQRLSQQVILDMNNDCIRSKAAIARHNETKQMSLTVTEHCRQRGLLE